MQLCNDKKQRIWEKYLQREGTDCANLLKQISGRVVQGLVCEHRPAERKMGRAGDLKRV